MYASTFFSYDVVEIQQLWCQVAASTTRYIGLIGLIRSMGSV